ncbi:MAG TPA: hypothetical protein EYO33_24140 [Phycisphaerales bacterium]|nr:hypothetical protein [Phycisphaerales bacterium]
MRIGATGDGGGGSIQAVGQVPAGERAAFVYTCYSANIAIVNQTTPLNVTGQFRLLTNWPSVDALAGVNAYSSIHMVTVEQSALEDPVGGSNDPLVSGPERFMVLWDPRPTNVAMNICAFAVGTNVLNDVYSFEAWGYYWDRTVMSVPGGLRHPGSD